MLVIGISHSQADFEIEEMYPSYGDYYDYSGFLYNTAYVKTSEPYLIVHWYINGKWVSFSWGDNVKTEAKFYPVDSDYPGSPFGKVYTIKAVAWSLADDENNHQSDTDSYDVTVYTPLKMDSFYGGYTYAEMEVWVDVGWNGMTAEIVVGGLIKNWDDENVYYGFNGMYKVGRLTKILKQDDEVYHTDELQLFDTIPKRKDNVVYTAWFGRTDSYTLGNLLPEYTYYVEAEVTITGRHTNDDLKLQDRVVVDEHQRLSSEDFVGD